MYPPRFILQACGSDATGTSYVHLRFSGSNETMETEIKLQYGMHYYLYGNSNSHASHQSIIEIHIISELPEYK